MNHSRRVFKRILKVIMWLIIGLVLLFVLVALLIRIPAIQNKIVQTATSFISDKTHTRVEVGNVRISFPKSVVVNGVYLEDTGSDTLLYAGRIKVNMGFMDLFNNRVHLKKVTLNDVVLNASNSELDSLFNYQFLIDAFGDTLKKPADEPSSPSKWSFAIDKVSLNNIRLRYDDAYTGVFAHLSLGYLKLKMDEINLVQSVYRINDLFISDLVADVLLSGSQDEDDDVTEDILPTITAKRIRINHSKVSFGDSIQKLSVVALVNRLGIGGISIDLHKQTVQSKKVSLSESDIRYCTAEPGLPADSGILATNDSLSTSDWVVSVQRIDLNDNTLSYKVGHPPAIKGAFDPKNMQFSHLSLAARDLYYDKESTKVLLKSFSAIDQNGFAIKQGSADFWMDPHSVNVRKLKMETNRSAISADAKIGFSSLNAFQDSLPFILLDLNMKNVRVSNADILYFAKELSGQPFLTQKRTVTTISGVVKGSLNNLRGKNLVIRTGAKTIATADFHILGLPDIGAAWFDFPDLHVVSGRKDIEMMAGALLPDEISIPEHIDLQVVFKGWMKSFETNMGLRSSFGIANLEARLDQREHFSVNASAMRFDLGRLLKDTVLLGPISFTANAVGQGLDLETIQASIKAHVTQMMLNHYDYHDLKIDGMVAGKEFKGKINLNDKHAEFAFDGLVNLNPQQERYQFSLDMKGANLQKLHITKEDIRIGFVASADLSGGSVALMNGTAGVANMVVVKGKDVYALDSLIFATINASKKSRIDFNSSLIGVKYAGNISPANIVKELKSFVQQYFAVSESIAGLDKSEPSDFSFEIRMHDHPIISKVLLPQLKVFEPGLITGSFDSEKSSLKLNVMMKRIVYGPSEINDLVIDVHSDSSALNYQLSTTAISSARMKLEHFLVKGKLQNNTLFADVSSIDDRLRKKLLIRSQTIKENGNYKIVFDPKDFFLMNEPWRIAEDHYILFGKEGYLIHNLFMDNDLSMIHVASVHDRFKDDIQISVKEFSLDDVAGIIANDTSMVKGTVDGNVLLKRVGATYGIIADAKISNLVYLDVPIGNVVLSADNPTAGRFDLDLGLSGADNQLTAKGYYLPNGGDQAISIQADIQSLSMTTIKAFSMDYISEAEGMVTGKLFVHGAASAPDITGELVFHDVFIKPSALNNRLELKHETIYLSPNKIQFKGFTVLDSDRHPAKISGEVRMKQFKDFFFALSVTSDDFLLFNTTVKDNQTFFGRMVIDSKIDINGPMALPVIDGRVKVKEGSNFTFVVPESELTADRGDGVVEFEDSISRNAILNRPDEVIQKQSGFTGFDLSTIIEIDKQATLKLMMDPTSRDSLVVRGEAALSFSMDRSGKMSLTGAYNLDEGSYLVSLQSVVKRKFDIIPGSTIIWSGDPLDAEISINAKYTVRAAPYDLIVAQMSGMSETEQGTYKQRYPFWVILKLRGAILRPVISFGIELPPEDKGILGGAVHQKLVLLNEDASALNKQVFALLIMGRFVQENPLNTGSGGTSAMVRSTVGNYLSAQLNKLSAKAIPGTELSVDVVSYDDYETGQAEGRTQVEIGVKKQLFNERLSVQLGGSVDVEGEKAKENSASDITSDVTVEYKLTKDGRYRLKGFRHNQYEGAIDGKLIETGAGVVYVRDFNDWRELFKAPKMENDSMIKEEQDETIETP